MLTQPDLGQNRFQKLSADGTSRSRVKLFQPVHETLVLISSAKNRGSNKSANVLLNLVNKFRAHPAISNCSHLLLKIKAFNESFYFCI